MAFGPRVRMWWTTGTATGGVAHGSLVMDPGEAAALARDIANAALVAAEWRPKQRLVAITPDGGRVYSDDGSDEGSPQ